MILVIPSIELKSGYCTHCIIGESGTEKYYQRLSRDPVELVKLLRRENTKAIHIIDGDSIENKDNSANLENISYITKALDIPVQVYSKFDSYEKCETLLESGVYRIFIDKLLLTDKKAVIELIDKYTNSRIAFNAVDENNDFCLSLDEKSIDFYDYFNLIKEVHGTRILFGKKSWIEGDAIDFDLIEKIVNEYRFRMTVSEGVESPESLWELSDRARFGIDSVVIGKALYDNNFPCQKIWRLIEAKKEAVETSRNNPEN